MIYKRMPIHVKEKIKKKLGLKEKSDDSIKPIEYGQQSKNYGNDMFTPADVLSTSYFEKTYEIDFEMQGEYSAIIELQCGNEFNVMSRDFENNPEVLDTMFKKICQEYVGSEQNKLDATYTNVTEFVTTSDIGAFLCKSLELLYETRLTSVKIKKI